MDKLLSGKPLGSLGREIDQLHEELTQMTTGEKRYPKEDRPFEKKAALPEGLEKKKENTSKVYKTSLISLRGFSLEMSRSGGCLW